MQFAYVKVRDPNTALPKNVLIAWCGEGVPERTKGYFTSHLSAVSRFLHVCYPSFVQERTDFTNSNGFQGYHVQITARADGDLTPEGIIQKVADSSGSKYSSSTEPPPVTTAPKPAVASKPVFTPARTGGVAGGSGPSLPTNTRPGLVNRGNIDDDGWGADAPPVTRTQLEKVEPAYKPTRVNLQDLKAGGQTTTGSGADDGDRGDVVKGGYQPIGKVDIAAIRRQAREAGELRDDRPQPVKGSYEPVGKVDLGAIRSRAQKPSDTPREEQSESPAASQSSAEPSASARLTSLPKPKVSNKVGAGPAFAATKPPVPTDPTSKPPAAAAQVGTANRAFADEGGKTPAQLWAEKKAKAQGGSAPTSGGSPSVASQQSGDSEWKSSYAGKSWAPVQTAHTGKSVTSNASDAAANERSGVVESETPRPDVNAIRNQFARGPPPPPPAETPSAGRTVPIPAIPTGPTEGEVGNEPGPHQDLPSSPRQARSPSPPSPPVRESSPIQIAAPVGRGVADAHDEQYAPPPAMPEESLRQAVPEPEALENDSHDIGRAAAETTSGSGLQTGTMKALVQYDYEKAEDNEVELREGEYVTDIEMVDEDWWLGVNVHGERGLFPSNYVEVVEDIPQNEPTSATQGYELEEDVPAPPIAEQFAPPPSQHSAAQGPTAAALYDYEAAEDNELSFPEGAEITGIVSYPLIPLDHICMSLKGRVVWLTITL